MSQQVEKLLSELKQNKVKLTDQRKELLMVLAEQHRPTSAEELFVILKEKNPQTCLATIYRNLDFFTNQGIVRQLQLSGNHREYELKGEEHHHYLICLSCKKAVKLENCPLHHYEKTVVADTDFIITEHRLSMYGYCPQCKP